MEGLDTLLRLPTGCGEQNIVKLGPDVYITDYLEASNQLSHDIETKALDFMEKSGKTTKTVPAQVHIDATGSGMALAEVSVFFNVESEMEDMTFDIAVNLIQETINWLVVETCQRWLGQEDTNAMVVQEIGNSFWFLDQLRDHQRAAFLETH